MTGGFSAEYGNRFGGVIDVVTKSGLSMQNEGSLAFSAGEAGRWTAVGDFGGRRGRFGYYVFGSAFESDRFLSPPDPEAIDCRSGSSRSSLCSAYRRPNGVSMGTRDSPSRPTPTV